MAVTRNNPQKDGDNVYRFYKSNLPAVVWDPGKGRSLAEFKQGIFETSNKKVAQAISDLGYPQVSPNATQPPSITIGLPGQSLAEHENAQLKGDSQKTKPVVPIVVNTGTE